MLLSGRSWILSARCYQRTPDGRLVLDLGLIGGMYSFPDLSEGRFTGTFISE